MPERRPSGVGGRLSSHIRADLNSLARWRHFSLGVRTRALPLSLLHASLGLSPQFTITRITNFMDGSVFATVKTWVICILTIDGLCRSRSSFHGNLSSELLLGPSGWIQSADNVMAPGLIHLINGRSIVAPFPHGIRGQSCPPADHRRRVS